MAHSNFNLKLENHKYFTVSAIHLIVNSFLTFQEGPVCRILGDVGLKWNIIFHMYNHLNLKTEN